jgi:hypothetical protein
MGHSDNFQTTIALTLRNNAVFGRIENEGSGIDFGAGGGNYTVGSWHHAAVWFQGDTSRKTFFDGSAGSEETSSSVALPFNGTGIGIDIDASARTNPMDGEIAEAAIWDVILTNDEVAMLAAGATPLMVRPGSLAGYWPLYTTGTEPDWVGDNPMTETGTVTKTSTNIPIMYPDAQLHMYPPLTAPTPVYEQVSFRFRDDNGSLQGP